MSTEKSENIENDGSQKRPDIALCTTSITSALKDKITKLWAPPPRESVSEWVEHNIILPESAAKPGEQNLDVTPWTREILEACNDPRIEKIVMMMGVQLAKTQLMLNILGYRIAKDPCPMLFLQPGQEDCEDFSKERLQPMLEDSPTLAARVCSQKSRNTSTTILRKDFQGGFIGLVGVNAPRGLRRRACGLVMADEIDEYPKNSGKQGNPLRLAEKRMRTFSGRNRKLIVASTPTIKDESAIETEYNNSTQEQWCIPCPSCREYQPYEWPRLSFNDGPGECGTPEMACRKCGAMHGEYEWKSGTGRWIARQQHKTNRGFHMNSMASSFVSWEELVEKFKQAYEEGPESIQVFINTELAELWESAGEKISDETLKNRRHYYNCDVPDQVVWITCGVDVQKDRLEAEIVGWGPGEESWGIQYAVLPGDPLRTLVWNDLDELISQTFVRSDGAVLPISCTAVDSQYATSAVHSFTRPRKNRYVFAIRGVGGPGLPIVGKVTRQGKNKDVFVFPVGTNAAKDLIFSNLSLDTEGPGYCHFPRDGADSNGQARGYDEPYFKGLLTEKRVKKRSLGRVWFVWEKPKSSARNEPLDCRVYATAGLKITNPPLAALAGQKPSMRTANAPARQQTAGSLRRSGWRVVGKSGGI
ncbi:MAG: phage terminase large subunit family protein [Armatimonadota bacterium]|nr:phage terminase large subunit family protein [bacterium]